MISLKYTNLNTFFHGPWLELDTHQISKSKNIQKTPTAFLKEKSNMSYSNQIGLHNLFRSPLASHFQKMEEYKGIKGKISFATLNISPQIAAAY